MGIPYPDWIERVGAPHSNQRGVLNPLLFVVGLPAENPATPKQTSPDLDESLQHHLFTLSANVSMIVLTFEDQNLREVVYHARRIQGQRQGNCSSNQKWVTCQWKVGAHRSPTHLSAFREIHSPGSPEGSKAMLGRLPMLSAWHSYLIVWVYVSLKHGRAVAQGNDDTTA